MFSWVNLSITFVYGVLIIGVFLLKYIFSHNTFSEIFNSNVYKTLLKKREFIILIGSIIVLLLNPHGIIGMLEPFYILKTSVFTLSEMVPIWTAIQTNPHPIYHYIFYLCMMTPIVSIYLLVRKKYILSFILTTVLILSMFQNRNITFFLLIFIPSAAFVIKDLGSLFIKKLGVKPINMVRIHAEVILAILVLLLSLPFFTNYFYKTFDIKEEFGAGFYETLAPAVSFLQTNKLPENIFNNFNMAGYLIYKTYPKYKPFIDNRPEAFSDDFVTNTYLPIFTNDSLRKKIFTQYNIQTVILQLDSGDQGARRLASVLYKDSSWRLAYLDSSTVIFTTDKKIKDIKSQRTLFEQMILTNNNYLELGKLASNLVLFGDNQLATVALEKANQINPDSCNIKRIIYSSFVNSGKYANAEYIKGDKWYCFY
jgi:hypothetical protein